LVLNLNLTAQNQVLSLDGDGDYMNSNVSYSNTHKTFELWAKSNIFNDIRTILLGIHNPLANGRFYFGYETDDGYLGLGLGNSIWNNESGGYLVDTNWHHYALIWNEPDMQLYLDGELIAEKSNTTMASDTYFIGAGRIWQAPWSDSHFTGVIDEVRIYNYAHTQQQIQAEMFTTLTGNETGLVGYWNFDDGTANDLTPNGNNGSLQGDANIIEEQIQGFANVFLNVIATSGDYFENANASVSLTMGELVTETFSAGNVILTQGFQQPISITIHGVSLDMSVYLEGPFESIAMNTDLNTAGVIPLSQPYNNSPWNYSGSENVGSIPNPDVVDWVLIELRDASSVEFATPSTIIEQKCCLPVNDSRS